MWRLYSIFIFSQMLSFDRIGRCLSKPLSIIYYLSLFTASRPKVPEWFYVLSFLLFKNQIISLFYLFLVMLDKIQSIKPKLLKFCFWPLPLELQNNWTCNLGFSDTQCHQIFCYCLKVTGLQPLLIVSFTPNQ